MKKCAFVGACAACGVVFALPVAGLASVVDLNPIKDTTLYETPSTSSNGSGSYLFAGRVGPGGGSSKRRALLKFDVAGSIPAGSVINSATLTLRMSKTVAGAQTFEIHKVAADWGEAGSNADGNEGSGDTALTGDATWSSRILGTSTWTTAGGDFSATVSASQTVDGIAAYTWGSTSQMVADVQAWLDTPASNFGWILMGGEAASSTAKRFDSRENNDIGGAKPVLQIDFTATAGASSQWMLY